jgi:hypothetical protein
MEQGTNRLVWAIGDHRESARPTEEELRAAAEEEAAQAAAEETAAAQREADEDTEDTVVKIVRIAPPKLGEAAYHGLAGEFLRAVEPYTEAPDAGVLAQLLPAIGMVVGPCFYVFGGNPQPPRINSVLVGPTKAGRKGTAFGPVDQLLEQACGKFWRDQRRTGLASGEGLIQAVADRTEKDEHGKDVAVPVEKRLYVLEDEFARVLITMRRDGNTLTSVIRQAFDHGNLSTLTVNPRKASGAHLSVCPTRALKQLCDSET